MQTMSNWKWSWCDERHIVLNDEFYRFVEILNSTTRINHYDELLPRLDSDLAFSVPLWSVTFIWFQYVIVSFGGQLYMINISFASAIIPAP